MDKEVMNQGVDKKMIVEILLAYSKEEWEQRRQAENQRSLMTNFILTIASATILLILNKGFTLGSLPFAIFLIPLGIFGSVAVTKLYERGEYHVESTKAWRGEIDRLYPEAKLMELREGAGEKHETKFSETIRKRIRLNKLWIYFNLTITLIGVSVALIILLF